jgi:hypothetical protein
MNYQPNPIFTDENEFSKVKNFFNGLQNLADRLPEGEIIDEGLPEKFWGYDKDAEGFLKRNLEKSKAILKVYADPQNFDFYLKSTQDSIDQVYPLFDYYLIGSTIIYNGKALLNKEIKKFNTIEDCIEFFTDLKKRGKLLFLSSFYINEEYSLVYIQIDTEEVKNDQTN